MTPHILTMLISICLVCNIGTAHGNDSIAVTYIANCGYLVEAEGHKIIIDGLFKRGHNHYSTPDTGTQKSLVSNVYPFNEIELILVSHTHEDHFDKKMISECMLNNPSVSLMAPQQVIDSIKENETVYNEIKSRIIECTPDAFTSQMLHLGHIVIYACRVAHPGEKHKDVQNIAYLISINGKTVFHSADIDPSQIDKYKGVRLNELNIDIGLINEDFAKVENAGLARKFINARYNIAMHLPDDEASVWLDSFKDTPDIFPNPFIFSWKMEKKVFYVGSGE